MHTYFTGSNNSSGACSLQTKFNLRVELCRTVKNEQEVVCTVDHDFRLGLGGKEKVGDPWRLFGRRTDDFYFC